MPKSCSYPQLAAGAGVPLLHFCEFRGKASVRAPQSRGRAWAQRQDKLLAQCRKTITWRSDWQKPASGRSSIGFSGGEAHAGVVCGGDSRLAEPRGAEERRKTLAEQEEIVSTNRDPDPTSLASEADRRSPLGASVAGGSRAPWSRFRTATVEITEPARVAVTRPGMPRLFRLLLALTGVRV